MERRRYKHHGGLLKNSRRYPSKEYQWTTNPEFISLENAQTEIRLPDPPEAWLKTFNCSHPQFKNAQSNPFLNSESTTKDFHRFRAQALRRRPLHPVSYTYETFLPETEQQNHEGLNLKRKFDSYPATFGGTPNFQNTMRPEMQSLNTFGGIFKSQTAEQFNFKDVSSDFTWSMMPITVTNNITSQNKSLNKPPTLISSTKAVTSTSFIPINRGVTVNMNSHPVNKSESLSNSTVPSVHKPQRNEEDDVIYLFTVDSSADGRIVEEINLCQQSESVQLITPKVSSVDQIDLSKESKNANVTLQPSNNTKHINSLTSSSRKTRKRKTFDEAENSSKRQNIHYHRIRCSACEIDYERLIGKDKQMYIAMSCGHSHCYSCAQKDPKVCTACGTKVTTFCRQYI